jgi:hypothetical protein
MVKRSTVVATKLRETIAEFLLWAMIFLDRALGEQDLREALGGIGVGEPLLLELRELQRETVRLDMELERARGEQRAASAKIELVIAAAKKPYMRIVELARVLFEREVERANRFELRHPRLRSRSGWLQQARAFFYMLLSDEAAVGEMDAHGLSRGELEHALALLEQVEQTMIARDLAAAEAREALRERDEAMAALDERLRTVIAIIRAMWKDRPDLLTRLGLD